MSKRFGLVLIVALASAAFFLRGSIPTIASGPAYAAPVVTIDTPLVNEIVSSTIQVGGWALDNNTSPLSAATAITAVTFSVDGGAFRPISYGGDRPDVCTVYPGRPSCPNVGFNALLDTTSLADGMHTITVAVKDGDPGSAGIGSTSITVKVQNGPAYAAPTVDIDKPTPDELVSGTINIAGWALDNNTNPIKLATPVTSVTVSVDGGPAQSELYGGDRPDVCTVYPGRPSCPDVGYNYGFNTKVLSDGVHTITVTAKDGDPGSAGSGSNSMTILVNNNGLLVGSTLGSSTIADAVSQGCSTAFQEIDQELTGSGGPDLTQSELDILNSEFNNDISGLCPAPATLTGSTSPTASSNTNTGGNTTLTNTNTSASVLDGMSPTGYLNSFIAELKNQGYTISENIDAMGEVIGIASKDGQTALSFDLGDQVVSGYPVNTSADSCTVKVPNATSTVPVLINVDGTIPHISQNFNVLVDPSAYSQVSWNPSLTQDQIQSNLISSFETAYSPYTEVAGVPQPTSQPNAGALVILAFANIPTTQYSYLDQNGQLQVYNNLNAAANTTTLIPGSSNGDYVPSGSSQIIADALNAGKQVAIITYNSTYFNSQEILNNTEFLCDSEHEPGHFLGLGDDYENGGSPMRGGNFCGTGSAAIIPISSDVAAALSGIQKKQSFNLNSCANQGAVPVNTNPGTGVPPNDFVPITSNGTDPSSIQWVLPAACTQAQIADGWINTTGGCYRPTPSASSSVSFGGLGFSTSTAATCMNSYGFDYACSTTNCGGEGQLACPANIPAGICLDASGNQISCPNGVLPSAAPITPPPPPPDQTTPSSTQPASTGFTPSSTSNICYALEDGSVSCQCDSGYVQQDGACVLQTATDDYCAENPTDPNCESYCASNPDNASCASSNGGDLTIGDVNSDGGGGEGGDEGIIDFGGRDFDE